MANLSRIQNRFDQLSSLIQEVEASQEVANLERLKHALLIWKPRQMLSLTRSSPTTLPRSMTSAAAGTGRWQEAAQRTASLRSSAMPGRI